MQLLRRETLRMYVALAKNILTEVAKGKRINKDIKYKELMDEMGGPGRGYIAQVLEDVSVNEHNEKRPYLSALVVHSSDGLPGDGFWYIRTLPDSVKNASKREKKAFWRAECERVRDYWAGK